MYMHPSCTAQEDQETLRSLMTPDPVTVGPGEGLDRAIGLLERHGFRHLPVVEEERVVGILSDRDLRLSTGMLRATRRARDHQGRKLPCAERVSEVMRSSVFCLPSDSAASRAAREMVEREIGALPVVDGGRLVGIVTETDLLQASLDLCRRTDGRCDDLARYHMHRPLTCVTPEITLEEALDALDRRIGHLGVVREQALIGILAERDLRVGLARAMIRDAQAQSEGRMEDVTTTVRQVMTHFVTTVQPGTMLSACASRMLEGRLSALPVLEDGVPIGIITQRNVLEYFAAVTASARSAVQAAATDHERDDLRSRIPSS